MVYSQSKKKFELITRKFRVRRDSKCGRRDAVEWGSVFRERRVCSLSPHSVDALGGLSFETAGDKKRGEHKARPFGGDVRMPVQ